MPGVTVTEVAALRVARLSQQQAIEWESDMRHEAELRELGVEDEERRKTIRKLGVGAEELKEASES